MFHRETTDRLVGLIDLLKGPEGNETLVHRRIGILACAARGRDRVPIGRADRLDVADLRQRSPGSSVRMSAKTL
jgi:hypothetical protein